MSLPKISVIIPTVEGREDHLLRCTTAYGAHALGSYDLELIVVHDRPSVGAGWQDGLEKVTGDFIHLTADDIEPCHGWHAPAIEAVEKGFLPAPQVYDPNGFPQSHPLPGRVAPDWTEVHMTSLPFCSTGQMGHIAPLFTAHYFTDDFFSWRGMNAGYGRRLRTGYAFVHYWAQHKRGAGMPEPQRMQHDERLFAEARKKVEDGQWNAPWPPNGGRP